MPDVQVARNDDESRYEARIEGDLVGVAEYHLTDILAVFTHTEVEPAHEGQGVGDALARYALDDVRGEGTRRVLAICPFIKAWIDRHPDYQPLLYGARPAQD